MKLKDYRALTKKDDGSIIGGNTSVQGFVVEKVPSNGGFSRFVIYLYTQNQSGGYAQDYVGEFELLIIDETSIDEFDSIVKEKIENYIRNNGDEPSYPIDYKIREDFFASIYMDEYNVDSVEELEDLY